MLAYCGARSEPVAMSCRLAYCGARSEPVAMSCRLPWQSGCQGGTPRVPVCVCVGVCVCACTWLLKAHSAGGWSKCWPPQCCRPNAAAAACFPRCRAAGCPAPRQTHAGSALEVPCLCPPIHKAAAWAELVPETAGAALACLPLRPSVKSQHTPMCWKKRST